MARIFGYHLQSAVTPYVILFIERDGSTYLTSLLAAHPDVQAVYERFAVLRQQGQNAQQQLEWARGFFTPPLFSRHAAVGFKTKLVDVLDPAGFAGLLQEKRCRVIQMQRRNRVKAVISRINAKRLHDRSGNWNLYQESDRQPPAAVDLAEFAEFLREREEADAELETYAGRLALPTLKLVYEDLLTDRASSIRRVFEFLRVRWLPVEGKTLKNTSDDLREAVLNFDELRTAYAGTAYEPMFDEVLAPSPA
jgi:LPS sulfotransferase NodH